MLHKPNIRVNRFASLIGLLALALWTIGLGFQTASASEGDETISQLTSTERKLIDSAKKGRVASYSTGVPVEDDPRQGSNWGADRTLRAEVIRTLIIGVNPRWKVGASGVSIYGAKIIGSLDFTGVLLRYPLSIQHSLIMGPVILQHASSGSLSFAGSYLAGIQSPVQALFPEERISLIGDSLDANGDVLLSGLVAKGGVRLVEAKISGSLDCSGSSIENPHGMALDATRIRIDNYLLLNAGLVVKGQISLVDASIRGSVVATGALFDDKGGDALMATGTDISGSLQLDGGFQATGAVKLDNAHVGQDLVLSGATLNSTDGFALEACHVKVAGNVTFNDGFTARGAVCLRESLIGGNLDCRGGRFHAANPPSGTAIDLRQARVSNTMYISHLVPDGMVDLSYAEVRVLSDDRDSWPIQGSLRLDGFTYQQLDPQSPTDASDRLSWLLLQPADEFSTQPYQQLAATLMKMGDEDDAREVLFAEHGLIQTRGKLSFAAAVWNWILYLFVGYGYRVWYSGFWAFGIVACGAFVSRKAAGVGILINASDVTASEPQRFAEKTRRARVFQWLDEFVGDWIYSLEVFLPFARFDNTGMCLRQRGQQDWFFHLCKIWYVFEESAGWIITALVVAALGGLIR